MTSQSTEDRARLFVAFGLAANKPHYDDHEYIRNAYVSWIMIAAESYTADMSFVCNSPNVRGVLCSELEQKIHDDLKTLSTETLHVLAVIAAQLQPAATRFIDDD